MYFNEIILLFLCLGSPVALYVWVLYPWYFSPLAKIPNAHWLSPFTSLWIQWRRFNGKEHITVWEAIQRKGNVVRLGPNELLVNTYNGGIRTIYGGGFEKPDWYNFFKNHGESNIFTSLGKSHTSRRRRITNVYSKTFVQESPHVQAILKCLLFERFLPSLVHAATTGSPHGVLGLNLAYGLDTVSAFMVGLSRGTPFIQDHSARNSWLAEYLKSHPNDFMFWLLEAPKTARFLEMIGIRVVPSWVADAHHSLESWALKLVDETEDAWSSRDTFETGDTPLVFGQLRTSLTAERESRGIEYEKATSYQEQRLEIASEILDQLVATRDVFGITFTYILWEISKNPTWQKKLQAELRAVPSPLTFPSDSSNSSMISPKELEQLPTLNIVIKESMRLRGTLPVPNPRITPYGKSTTIGPYSNIPGGVRTDSFAWCLHRDESVYPEAEKWKPERWIRTGDEKYEMDRQFWAFGSGSRLCLGMSLAMEMIRYAVAGIYTNFSTTVEDDSQFCVDGHFVTGLAGEDLLLKFEKLDPIEKEKQ